MKQLSLTKYGFVHNHNRDFSDDGTRFQVYELPGHPEVRATKASYAGKVFINFKFEKMDFYNLYSRLNGIARPDAERIFAETMNFVVTEWIDECEKKYAQFISDKCNSLQSQIDTLNRKLDMYRAEVARIAHS